MTEAISIPPDDRHNRTLVDLTHPADWRNPAPAERYNLVVLGAGTAGLVTAAGAAGLGAKVALVESRLMGGDCLNQGCVPSKCLIRSARAVGEIRRAAELGVLVEGPVRVDFARVMERMRAIRSRVAAHDSVQRFAGLGVDVFLGRGRFSGPNRLEVAGRTLSFAKAVIATGSGPGGLPFEGLAETGYLTNETVFELEQPPGRLCVLGTGPIGCELAQCFQRFGSRVTMVGRSGQIMTREDPDAAGLVAASLNRDGLDLRLNTGVARVFTEGSDKVVVLANPDGSLEELRVDQILVGAGRVPKVSGLGLEEAGVIYDKKAGIRVDDGLRTSNPDIYAAGDVCMAHKFTHAAEAAARIVIQNALFPGKARLSALNMPWCTYTDPEVAHVGLQQGEAVRQGLATQEYRVDFDDLDRAIADGQEDGFVKLLVKRGGDQILGATIVASHAGEMIGEISVAMAAGVGLKTLANVIHPYPTQAEAIKRAADAYNRTRLTPTVKKFLGRYLQWRR